MKNSIIVLALLLSIMSNAQDLTYSRKSLSPLLINPGMTGLDVDLRASIHHRNQWSNIVTPYQTSHFSFDSRLARNVRGDESFLSLGAMFYNDRAGSANLITNKAKLFLSGNIAVSRDSRLSLGLMGGFGQRSIDQGQLTWGNQYDGSYNSNIQSNESMYADQFSFLDIGSGIVWSYGEDSRFIGSNDALKFKVGYSIYHLGVQKYSFEIDGGFASGIKHLAFANAEIGIGQTHLTLLPEIYFTNQRNFKEIILGSGFRYLLQEGSRVTGFVKEMAITPAVYYRVGDALIAAFDMQYAHYTFGFSYDINVSSLSQASRGRGAVEFHFRFQMPNPFMNKTRARI
jgi:type IX secretion system PorP/SprF family membrane protein